MKSKLILLSLFVFSCFKIYAKTDSIPLAAPSGEYAVGTMLYYWTDSSRKLNYSSFQGDQRTIAAQIWYPAEKEIKSVRAPYAGLYPDYRLIKTNAYLRTPFHNEISKAPVILFVPGKGLERFAYSGVIEELASHGFVVISIDMPELGFISYPDGLTISPSEKFEAPTGLFTGPYEKVDAFYEEATKLGFADMEFVLRKIEELNTSDPSGRFTGRFDLKNIGVFGHSLGGRIAGEFTAKNNNVRAYASMEGIPPREVRLEGKIKVPSLMLCSNGTLYYAKENYKEFTENKTSRIYIAELIDFGSNSITDGPLLFPRSYKYPVDPFRALEINRKLLRDFYKMELMQVGEFGTDLSPYLQIKLSIYE